MNFNEDQIISYIRGELPEKEARKLEAEMEVDHELRKEVNFHRKLMKGLEKQLKTRVKAKLKEKEAEENSEGSRFNTWIKPLYNYWRLAAMIIIILTGGIFGAFFWDTEPSDSKLAQNHFEPYPNHITQQIRGKEQGKENPLLMNAMNQYSAKRYDKAIKNLKKVINRSEKAALAHFYLGNAYLAKSKGEQAALHFKSAKRKDLPTKFQNPNQWFLALAYLEQGKNSKADELLDKVKERSNDFYKKQAKELENQLRAGY